MSFTVHAKEKLVVLQKLFPTNSILYYVLREYLNICRIKSMQLQKVLKALQIKQCSVHGDEKYRNKNITYRDSVMRPSVRVSGKYFIIIFIDKEYTYVDWNI